MLKEEEKEPSKEKEEAIEQTRKFLNETFEVSPRDLDLFISQFSEFEVRRGSFILQRFLKKPNQYTRLAFDPEEDGMSVVIGGGSSAAVKLSDFHKAHLTVDGGPSRSIMFHHNGTSGPMLVLVKGGFQYYSGSMKDS